MLNIKKLVSKIKLKRFKFTKKRVIILVILAVVLGGFFIFKGRSQKEVATTTIQRGTVSEELILSGAIKAEKHATLTFPTSGKISWVGVVEGQKVWKGQGLTSLDKTVLNVAYQQALNNYRSYQASAENTLDSVKDHSSDETFSQKANRTAAEVARDNAYDAVRAAKYNLDNATILSPFNGIITSLPFPFAGINVSPGETQVELVDPTSVYFEVDADQSEVTSIKEGSSVVVILDSFGEKELAGKVSFIGLTPKAGEAGTIYKVKVKFTDPKLLDSAIKIGMTGDAKFILSQKENALYTTPSFVNSDKMGRFVSVGKAGNRVPVEVGIEAEDKIEITKGVAEGDTLYD